jgi:hypothetical protein
MRRFPLLGSLCLALALNVAACGDDDDSSEREGFEQTGGNATGGTLGTTGGTSGTTGGIPSATGGIPGATGGTPGATGGIPGATGGSSGTTGGTSGTTGGTSGTTGGSSGTTGGTSGTTGGSSGTTGGAGGTGGATVEAGAGGAVPVAGSTNEGGSTNGGGGVQGTGGSTAGPEAGAGGANPCSGYVKLFAAFEAKGDAVELPLSLGETPVDLSATAIVVHLKVLEPNAGGMQVFAKNGEALDYKGWYGGWTELVASPDWQDLTLNLADVEPAGAGGAGGAGAAAVFDKSQVMTAGLQVTTGDRSPFAGGTTILVDSVTFSDHPELNVDFAAEDPNLTVSDCGTICETSSVTWQECE